MASWREIERVRKDPKTFRAVAGTLLTLGGWNEWESGFLEGLAHYKRDELTNRQAERLLEIRDGIVEVESIRGFSVAALIRACYLARHDLDDEDETWIAELHAGGKTMIRRRHGARLMRCARQLYIVDEVTA